MNIDELFNSDRRVYLPCKGKRGVLAKTFFTPKYTWPAARLKTRAAVLSLLLLAAASACLPAATSAPPPAELGLQAVEARHTQEWVEIYQTGTAAAAVQSIATEAAVEKATEQAAAVRSTATAESQAATRTAGTQAAVISEATATAQAGQMASTATQAALFATATVQSARAATVATQEAAEQRRIELTTGARALIPWLLVLATAAVLLVIISQYGKAIVRQKGVIRQANGDVHTILLDVSPYQKVQTINPEKALDPVLRMLPEGVSSFGHADPRMQYLLTHNNQMLQLAREYVRANRRITDPDQIEQVRQLFEAGRPPAPAGPQLIHPLYGIDPRSLPEIPLFDVGSRLLSGGSRSGKTNLAQYDLFRMKVEDLAVFDPKFRPGKWPAHARILTKPEQLLERLVLMNEDFEQRRDSQGAVFPPVVTVIDEYTALVELAKMSSSNQAIKDAMALAWALVMYGTEFNVTVWILSQTSNAASLGLSGRGDYRDSLTRIHFEWRPTSSSEMEMPRIAEVSRGESTAKYLVPRWSPAVPELSPGSPGDSLGQSGIVPDGFVAFLRSNVPSAAEFTNDELVRLVRMYLAGESGNAIREALGRNRSWVYELLAACRQYEETK